MKFKNGKHAKAVSPPYLLDFDPNQILSVSFSIKSFEWQKN